MSITSTVEMHEVVSISMETRQHERHSGGPAHTFYVTEIKLRNVDGQATCLRLFSDKPLTINR